MSLTFSTSVRNAFCTAVSTAIGDAGLLRIYDGARPASVGAAVTSQVLLAELIFDSPFAGIPNLGVLTANEVTGDPSSNASGTATWFRILRSDGVTAVVDGSVGVSGADLILTDVTIAVGVPAHVSSLQFTAPGA
jgi:hypothetical protein